MPQVAGVTTQTDNAGNITHVTINVEKHRADIMPLLEKLGVVEKSQFDRDFERGISVEEFKNRAVKHVGSLWGK